MLGPVTADGWGSAVVRPVVRPFRGRAKWDEVIGNLVLVVLGALAVTLVLVAVPADVLPIGVTVGYTVVAGLATAALAVATATTRRLPGLGEARLDGEPALVVRGWSGEWWYHLVLDSALVVLAGVLVALGLAADPSWRVPSLVLTVPGAWFLVRVLLTLTGRRRNEALWLTPDEIVHDTSWGRERVRRDQVVRVRASTVAPDLVLHVDAPVRRQLCPRPWRQRVGSPSGRVVVDCSRMGHEVTDLADWLREELVVATGTDDAVPPV